MSNTNHTFHPTAIVAVNEALVVLGQDVLLDELSQTSESCRFLSMRMRFCYAVCNTEAYKVCMRHWVFFQ